MGELELHDFKKYANMFSDYRCASVWSPPECLKQPRKKLDPTTEMDIYSFGMLMWEVLHQTVPFDGDLKVCTDYVVNSESRPKIDEETGTVRYTEAGEEERLGEVSDSLAEIIRMCWQTDQRERPKMAVVCQKLLLELSRLLNQPEGSMAEQPLETSELSPKGTNFYSVVEESL